MASSTLPISSRLEKDNRSARDRKFFNETVYGESRRLCRVYRYSSTPVNRLESVAEHSWYVSYMALSLYYHIKIEDPDIQIDRGELLSRCIVHDLDECLTGDLPRPFKYSSPELKDAIHKASMQMFEDYVYSNEVPEEILKTYKVAKEGPEGEIVSFCDLLGVLAYLHEEVKTGNRLIIHKASEILNNLRSFQEIAKIPCLKRLAVLAAEDAYGLHRYYTGA